MKNTESKTYADRLAYAMQHAGKTNQSELAREVSAISASKVTPQTIQHLVSEGKGSTHNAKLAKVLGVSPLWLETGKGEMVDYPLMVKEQGLNYASDLREANTIARVPVISWVQAGNFCEAIDNFAPGDADEWLPCPVPCGTRTYALRVVGDSMTSPYPHERSYPEGITIFVDPDKAYENGSRVIAKVPATNEVTFKKLVMDSGRVFLRPLNPAYPTTDITSEIHICGVIIGSFSAE